MTDKKPPENLEELLSELSFDDEAITINKDEIIVIKISKNETLLLLNFGSNVAYQHSVNGWITAELIPNKANNAVDLRNQVLRIKGLS